MGTPAAQAQVATEAKSTELEAIIVTAQKRSENIQDVPIAISALTEAALERRKIDSLQTLASQTAGISFVEMSGTGRIAIRGVGFNVHTGAGENAVAVHRDGVYIPATGAAGMAQYDLGRVEILRGPQGTLYGRNSTAGVINYISKTPSSDISGEVEVGYGNLDRTAKAALAGEIAPGWRARISGHYKDTEGDTHNLVSGNDLGGNRSRGLTLALDGRISDRVKVELRALNVYEAYDGPVPVPADNSITGSGLPATAYVLSESNVRLNFDPRGTRSLRLESGAVTFDLMPNVQLKSLTGYVDYRTYTKIDPDASAVSLFILDPRNEVNKAFSEELNLTGSFEKTQFIFGLYYQDQRQNKAAYTDVPVLNPFGVRQLRSVFSSRSHNYSAFADVTQAITERLKIYGGLRYLRDEQNTQLVSSTALMAGPVINSCVDVFQLRDDAVTGRIGAQYKMSDGNMAYAQYAVGYKAGGASPSGCNNSFKPERLRSTEIGLKTSPMPGLIFNASAYYYDYIDAQIQQAVGTSFFIRNADSRLWGLDLETQYQVDERWSVRASATFLDSKFRNFKNVDQVFPANGPVDLSGKSILFAPNWAFGVGTAYTLPLANGGDLTFDGSLNATAKYKLREFGIAGDVQPSMVTGNASLTYNAPKDRFYVRAWGRNLGDERVRGGIDVVPALPGAVRAPYRVVNLGPPRSYGVDIGVRF